MHVLMDVAIFLGTKQIGLVQEMSRVMYRQAYILQQHGDAEWLWARYPMSETFRVPSVICLATTFSLITCFTQIKVKVLHILTNHE